MIDFQSFRLLAACLFGVAMAMGCQSDEEKLADFLSRGDAALEAGNPNEAVIEYRNVIQIDPNNSQAHYGVAQAYLRQGNLKAGYWELSESVRLDPSNLDARRRFGSMSIAARDFDQVLEQAEALIAAEPEGGAGYHLKAQALDGQETPAEAEAFHLKAVELDPENYEYLVVLSKYYARQLRFDDAEKTIQIYTEADPGFVSFSQLGRFYVSSKRLDDAEAAFRTAVELDDGKRTQGYLNLAVLYLEQRRIDDAIEILKQGVDVSEGGTELSYNLARIYAGQGEQDKARELLVQGTLDDPGNPRVHLILSEYLGSQGDLEAALLAAEAAGKADPESRQAQMRKAELLVDMGFREKEQDKIVAASNLVNEVLAKAPTDADALLVRSKIEMAEGRPAASVESLQAAIQTRPNWPDAHFLLGSALALVGDTNGSRMELARALELDGRMLKARALLAQVHAELGEHEYAVEQGRAYLQVNPDDTATRILVAQSLVRLGKLDDADTELQKMPEEGRSAEALYAIGRIQMARGDVKSARENLIKVDELEPGQPEILGSLVALDIRAGNAGEGISRIESAIEADPTNAGLLQLRAQVALSQNDSVRAEETLRKAIELNSNDLNSYRLLAGLYQRQGRFPETITTYEAAVEVRPDAADILHFLGVLYEHQGDRPVAIQYYEKAISYDSNLGDAKNNLAYLLAEEGRDLDRALSLAQEAKALMPESANAADTLGWVLYKRGVNSAAVGYLRESEEGMDPESQSLGLVRLHLASAYEANGENDKAIASLDRALAAFEKHKAAAEGKGVEITEPDWVEEVRVMRTRVAGSGAG
jgi:tetratricopeptide (TPR) repeat protein